MEVPCESRFAGFFRVSWTDEVVIAKDGSVLNTRTGNLLKPILRNHGYLSVNLIVNRKEKQYLLHRLIAGAFIPVPEKLKSFKRLQVNHIDGDKTNNSLSNLEWLRPQQNMHHAFKNRLIDFSTQVLSKDVRTGVVKSYVSAAALALELDINSKMLRRHLESDQAGRQSIEWKVFKYDDGSDWPVLPHDWKIETTFNHKSAFVIKDLSNNVVMLSPTLKKFCETIGVNYHDLKNNRQRYGSNKPFMGRYDILETTNYQTLDVDVVIEFCIRGSNKDKRIFRITTDDRVEHTVVGALALCKYIKYDYGYVCNLIANQTKVKIAEFTVELQGQTGITLPKV